MRQVGAHLVKDTATWVELDRDPGQPKGGAWRVCALDPKDLEVVKSILIRYYGLEIVEEVSPYRSGSGN